MSNSPQSVRYSVVIPIYNEEPVLEELYNRLTVVLDDIGGSYELLFVDDGSGDGSIELLRAIHQRDSRVKVISFTRNFGHHLAITAGLDHCRGEAVILMDGDLQDQPEEIPALIEKFQEGYDVVYAIRKERKDRPLYRWSSQALMALVGRAMRHRFPISAGIFRVISRQVVEALKTCRETDRFIIGMIDWLGFKQVGVDVSHGQRFAGPVKYSLRKRFSLALNMVTTFTYYPLRFATFLGFGFAFLSFFYGVYLIVRKLLYGYPIMGYASTMVSILFIGSVQLVVLGILGEYLGRVFRASQNRPLYVVQDMLE
ncbi:MAG: glycosyltransferase family 2 protein [bacterium]|nr:glycosyltransferase family 2 protein [bacterium]